MSLTRSTTVALLVAAITAACMSRPVAGVDPSTKTSFNTVLRQQAVDKVDLLFAIDNSRSMGDKQKLLVAAVPDLITRLLQPDCIDSTDPNNPKVVPGNPDGSCVDPAKPEFPPVYDMHIGIVSSSLGGGGAEQGPQPICASTALEPVYNTYSAHADDRGHLLNRVRPSSANATGVEDTIPDAVPVDGSGGDFLAWLPNVPKNAGKPAPDVPVEPTEASIQSDFASLVSGTQEYGCGLEAQMESWYRFLVQPDPYESIQLDTAATPRATLVGTDAVVIKQRYDFLRPDSLVAVIMMTDEEDSWSDPLAISGRGWVTRAAQFPGSSSGLMPLPTSACAQPVDPENPTMTGPGDPACQSCGFAGTLPNGKPIASDPNCQASCGQNCTGYYTGKDDNLNIRYVNDMKRRYGLDPQFPVSRYVSGLKSLHVPNRDGEHQGGSGPYTGRANCINPLFARTLPKDPTDSSLCDPANQATGLGPRSPDLVFFALIGGVPWQLLADDQGAFKSILSSTDWRKIIGEDPDHYDLTGVDPHMIESYLPRVAANQASIPYLASPLADVTSPDNADPFNGREWDTTKSPLGLDLQYACTFALPTPKECADPINANACDCASHAKDPGGVPLCAPGLDGNSLQVRGKAYPTIRELRVAKSLGAQAIVASLCPKEPTNTASPDYGYRPAVRQIIDRLKSSLAGQCLPRQLTPDASGSVPCLILETLPLGGGQDATSCDPAQGFSQPDLTILDKYNEQRCADAAAGGTTSPCANPDDPAAVAAVLGPVCEVVQLTDTNRGGSDYTGSCEALMTPGWCYLVGVAAGGCPQAIRFSAAGQPLKGAKISLQCIESTGG